MIADEGCRSPAIQSLCQAGEELRKSGVPVCRLGVFGSAVYDPTVKDLDVLLTLDATGADPSDIQRDIQRVLSAAIARMEGDYSSPAPVDLAAQPFLDRCVQAIRSCTSLPLVFGLGPSNKHDFQGQWIHLNGPMHDGVWQLFCREYPVHGLTIHHNYLALIGDPPTVSAISGEALLKYCDDMARRNRSMPTLKTADKVVRVLALFAGERRAVRSAAVDKVFGWVQPVARRLLRFFASASDTDASPVTLALIEAVRSMADLMRSLDLQYPRDWVST